MLRPAGVLVHWQPLPKLLGIEGAVVVVGAGVAHHVPRGVDEGVHGVGLAPGVTAALGTGDLHEAEVDR